MAHYAFLDANNIVTEVITGIDENELVDGLTPEQWYGEFRGQKCVRTSYNHNIRFRYAGMGYTYNENLDAFITPQPFPSWTLNEVTTEWEPPVPQPEGMYSWDEETQNWTPSNIV
jgi:hypothetical protein